VAAKLLVALAPLIVLGGSGCGGQHFHKTNNLIILDRSIGGASLQETRSQAEKSLGTGRVLSTGRQGTQVAYRGGGLIVCHAEHPLRAFIMKTTSPAFHTASGIGVGSSFKKLNSIRGITCYGGECQHGYHAHGRPGTGFGLDAPQGKVVWIGIGFGH